MITCCVLVMSAALELQGHGWSHISCMAAVVNQKRGHNLLYGSSLILGWQMWQIKGDIYLEVLLRNYFNPWCFLIIQNISTVWFAPHIPHRFHRKIVLIPLASSPQGNVFTSSIYQRAGRLSTKHHPIPTFLTCFALINIQNTLHLQLTDGAVIFLSSLWNSLTREDEREHFLIKKIH